MVAAAAGSRQGAPASAHRHHKRVHSARAGGAHTRAGGRGSWGLRDLGSDPRRAPARLSSGSISSSSSPSTATKYVRVATQPRPGACRGEFGDACAPRTHKQHSPLTHPPHPPVPSHPRNPCCTHILYAWAIVALQHRRGTPEDLHGAPPLLPGRARGGRCHDGARALSTLSSAAPPSSHPRTPSTPLNIFTTEGREGSVVEGEGKNAVLLLRRLRGRGVCRPVVVSAAFVAPQALA